MPKLTQSQQSRFSIISFGLVVVISLLAYLAVARNMPQPVITKPTASVMENNQAICDEPLLEHKEVRVRKGILLTMTEDTLIIKPTDKVPSRGNQVTVLVPDKTKVINVQAPSFMSPSRQELLVKGGSPIERVEVPLNSLMIGQELDVITEADAYCQAEVVAQRIEYVTIINTDNES